MPVKERTKWWKTAIVVTSIGHSRFGFCYFQADGEINHLLLAYNSRLITVPFRRHEQHVSCIIRLTLIKTFV